MSTENDKNETSRFLGEGVSFKAKLIGILEVSEARGDRMCQEALSDLKMAIRAAGEHKQRITINIAIDGLRLRDEKTGDSLYHHPVHKISFIAQDMSDSRAFGYIFGSPDTGHRFFGIKTDKAASQVVIAMRDLFQVVFALKKKEIELAKQHLDKSRYGTSPLFSERSLLSLKQNNSQDTSKSTASDTKGASSTDNRSTPAVADLVDLELELSSLQQGLTQMERITPSDPFGSKDDPFGDSFTSFPVSNKGMLPPPPSSGRERSNRTSESSSLFSPKTPHTGASADSSSTADLFTTHELNTPKEFSFNEFNSSHDEPSSGDWFTPPAGNSLFEEPPLLEPTKDQQHEAAKQEIMSQFDVFTELDPLGTKTLNTSIGTGKIKPYVDKKHFFQELKNPPKKVLNDLVSESQPADSVLFTATSFEQKNNGVNKSSNSIYNNDPFGEDPFDQTDPFADSDFSKQDVFEVEFNDFKVFNTQAKMNDLSIDNKVNNNADLSGLFGLSKSPNSSFLERQGSSPKTVGFLKQNTFENQFDYKNSLTKLYENPSLDMSSESECAPDPPPRPAASLPQIKPPPLPPKKQMNELSMKPPPRPPYSEESHYDYMDKYESGSKTSISNEASPPPLPVPARKSKFESDFVPEEEDYLTPITFPTVKKDRPVARNAGPILLPPPQKAGKKKPPPEPVSVSPILETETKTDNLPNLSLDSLDITLSQLTLSGLNELANKLNIPASQLSNMTLVQLTNYLSNFIKNASNDSTSTQQDQQQNNIASSDNFAGFNSDFADFNQFNSSSSANAGGGGDSTYDRYAVFRELLQEEIKQTKIDSEPQEIVEEMEKMDEAPAEEVPQVSVVENVVDKYAALREIVESELKISDNNKIEEENENEEDEEEEEEEEPEPVQLETIDEVIAEQNSINEEKNSSMEQDLNTNNLKIIDDLKNDNEKVTASKENIIDYDNVLDNVVDVNKSPTPIKSPIKVKSPVPVAVTEIVQSNTRLNSGSLSDVISGSSPEVDLTGSASENAVKKESDPAGESWAIFDQPNLVQESSKDAKAVQSEEGVSPWSSDSKEFGNGSPPEWRPRVDSGSGGEHWVGGLRPGRRDQEGWWDTSAEPEVQYYPANRRSTDSYDEECYDCYDRPRRRRQTTWSGGQTGGHSSSSRDVSPWEEEPRRREGRQTTWSSRHSNRQHSFERHNRDRRHTDSWDEDDDYEYEDEHSGRFHWPERHPSRDSDRDRHPIDRHSTTSGRDMDEWDERRLQHRRRREMDRERWCCPDYDTGEQEKPSGRYSSGRWATTDRRKHDDRYYGRDLESPWEDEYGNEPEEPQPHYLTARRTRIRPSSASEMDRKTGEIKARPGQFYYGGSDGERDRRYKAGRRSKSRDSSQYPESMHAHNRHKIDPGLTLRNPHRLKHPKSSSQFDGDFAGEIPLKKLENPKEIGIKKPLGASGRKKSKESPKTEEISTFPRKGTSRAQSLFENDFVPSESESPVSARAGQRFTFENDFETSEAESPTVSKPSKVQRPKKPSLNPSWFEADSRRPKNNTKPIRYKQKSLFEDDFSPTTEKPGEGDDSIPSIKEEHGTEGEDSLGSSNFENSSSRKRLSKIANRDGNLKKSESVNIFARENDPFDDDFFSTNTNGSSEVNNSRNSELKWTEQFSDFDIQRAK